MRANTTTAILFPVHGCEKAKPLTEVQMKAMLKKQLQDLQKNWENPGVKALVQMIEIEAATLQGRACLPGATLHDAGQGFALGQLVAKIQRKRWEGVGAEVE